MNNKYQSPYTNEYDNYLTHTISRKNADYNAMPYNPYMMANFGNGMAMPLGLI